MKYLDKSLLQQRFIPYLVLASFFIISALSLWPGVMSLDATGQYLAAKAGVYSDHHPPMMSFVWRYLDFVYPGPAPMFMLHLVMLYAAAAIFLFIFNKSRFRWWYVFYPILPSIMAYTALIVKDTGFTYCYLLSAALMTFLCVNKVQRYRAAVLSLICLLLFYGTAVKFQAKFILLFFTLGVVYCGFDYKLHKQAIITGVGLFFTILAAVVATNAKLVPTAQEAHSWQYVKIYDLSAISIALDTPLYPDFILQQPQYSFATVKEKFLTREVDPLVFDTGAVIRYGANPEQRKELWDYWFKTIKQHPWLYLKCRLQLFSYNLTTAPCDRNNPVKFLSSTRLAPILNLPGMSASIDAGYLVFKIMLRFMWLTPLVIVYAYLGIKHFKDTRTAAPLLLLSLSSLTLMIVLLFFSMAATARYVFLCTCLMHAAHGLAYVTWKSTVRSTDPNLKRKNELNYILT